jgi:hypothetical protein
MALDESWRVLVGFGVYKGCTVPKLSPGTKRSHADCQIPFPSVPTVFINNYPVEYDAAGENLLTVKWEGSANVTEPVYVEPQSTKSFQSFIFEELISADGAGFGIYPLVNGTFTLPSEVKGWSYLRVTTANTTEAVGHESGIRLCLYI